VIAGVMMDVERDALPESMARDALTLCTDCGACQDHCHLHRPLPELLRNARVEWVPRPAREPIRPVEGKGDWIAVESDDRPFAKALSRALGTAVRRWKTVDGLGVETLPYPGSEEWLARLRSIVGTRRVVVISGGVAKVLTAAGIGFDWLHEVVRDLPSGDGSCAIDGKRPLACCGAAGPVSQFHPDDAARMARVWLDRSEEWRVRDARCRAHLMEQVGSHPDAAGGARVTDPLDALLERQAAHG
jgi:hypothetical protein